MQRVCRLFKHIELIKPRIMNTTNSSSNSTATTTQNQSKFTCNWLTKAKTQWTDYKFTKEQAKQQVSINKCEIAEQKLLEMNGINLNKDYSVQNTIINQIDSSSQQKQYLHSYRSLNQSPEKKNILLLHGYGMNGLAYMKMLTPLSSKYNVHCLDLPGMGLSSRDDFSKIQSEEATLDYFINAIESYRKQSDLKSFTLVGHSFGGFIGANYAMQHAHAVDQLVLLSPLGSTNRSYDEIKKQYDEILSRGGFFTNQMMKLYFSLFKNQVTLQAANQKWYLPVKTLLKRYFKAGLQLSEAENQVYNEFALNMIDLKESSDKGLYNIIKENSLFVKTPLEFSLSEKLDKSIPVHFLFGDKDWMDYQGAYRLFRTAKSNQMKVNFSLIENTRHQMTIDNPKAISDYLLNL